MYLGNLGTSRLGRSLGMGGTRQERPRIRPSSIKILFLSWGSPRTNVSGRGRKARRRAVISYDYQHRRGMLYASRYPKYITFRYTIGKSFVNCLNVRVKVIRPFSRWSCEAIKLPSCLNFSSPAEEMVGMETLHPTYSRKNRIRKIIQGCTPATLRCLNLATVKGVVPRSGSLT